MSSCLWSSLLTRLTCLFTWWFIYMFFFFQRFFLFFNAQHSAPFDLGILLSNWRNILAWDRHGRDLSWSQCRSCGLLLLHVEWETPHIFDMLDFFSLCSPSDVLELIYDSGRHDDIMAGNGNEYVFQPIWELERRKIFIQLAYGLSGIFKYIIVYLPELQDEHVWKLDIFECSWNSLRKWYANVENSYIRIELSAED